MENGKIVLRSIKKDAPVIRMSKQQAKDLDKDQINQIILNDGTIYKVNDSTDKNPFLSRPQNITNQTTNIQSFKVRSLSPRESYVCQQQIYEDNKIDPSRESYGRIVQDEGNYLIYESGDMSKKVKQKLRTQGNLNKPARILNSNEPLKRITISKNCPICERTSLSPGVVRAQKLRAVPVKGSQIDDNKVYTMEVIPNISPRLIRTVVEDTDDVVYRRGETPVFTFKSGKKMGCRRLFYCNQGEQGTRCDTRTSQNYYCEHCLSGYHDDLCPNCSRPINNH